MLGLAMILGRKKGFLENEEFWEDFREDDQNSWEEDQNSLQHEENK